jgi:putative PIN family toxin of toxin-antitoxin system
MRRVVFDTVVLVRALINPHSIYGRIVFEHYRDYTLYVSPPMVAELLDVLQRPEISRKFRTLAGLDLRAVLDLVSQAEVIEPEIVPVSRDPNDDMFLATARAAQAHYLVSEDNDLLSLGQYAGTAIVNGPTFLQVLKGYPAQD